MLAIGINLVKVDYNRETVLVHHLTDDVTGKALPICGAGTENLMSERDAEGLLEDIKRGRDPLFGDNSSRMCERCRAIYLAPGIEEEKSERRLTRWRRKEARRNLIEEYERQVIAQWLGKCPKCQRNIEVKEPLGYSSAEAYCESCGLDWTFSVSTEHSGRFVIWADDETEKYKGRAEGHIKLKEICWEWQ